MVTRLQQRGILGAVADGRIRDLNSSKIICQDTGFQVWHKGVSAAGPSLEARSWAVDVPLKIGDVWVQPGDVVCADRRDGVVVIIPTRLLQSVCKELAILKTASEGVMEDVQNGFGLTEAVRRNPDFYSSHSHK